MAKINIPFDNTNYSIDESAISTASAALKSHLQTVMNGSGATINLGGAVYDVDSAKLAAATNAFIAHLGTVAGSGKKVVVNGVEYGIDSAKMASAITELHTVLGGLHTDDGDEGALPEKNEYGFYYNVPYVGTYEEDGVVLTEAVVFYENNTICGFNSLGLEDSYNGLFTYDEVRSYEYDTDSHTVTDEWGFGYIFNEDGTSFTIDGDKGDWGAVGTEWSSNGTAHGVYYERNYVHDNGDTIVFSEDGSAIYTVSGTQRSITGINWGDTEHLSSHDDYSFYISVDGSILVLADYSEASRKVFVRS
jgi:hypothetical protein